MTIRHLLVASACVALTACTDTPAVTSALIEPNLLQTTDIAPPGARPGSCWGKIETPATIETVKRKIVVQPAQITTDGIIQSPPVYRVEDTTRVIEPRKATWFETPCSTDLTPEFVSSVQRALKARKLYSGPISGRMDAMTRKAVRRFQSAEGLDSGILSVAAARKLGLWAVAPQEPPAA